MRPPSSRQTFLIFRLGGRPCAIDARLIQEIVPMAALACPPGLPSFLAGFLGVDGRTIAIIRLAHLFDLPEETPELFTPILILRHGTPSCAILAQRVDRMVEVADEAVLPVPQRHILGDCARGAFIMDGGPVIILDPDRLLLMKERRCLEALAAVEQSRLRNLQTVTA
jgi:purine-binding chemotaxis protein CheW